MHILSKQIVQRGYFLIEREIYSIESFWRSTSTTVWADANRVRENGYIVQQPYEP